MLAQLELENEDYLDYLNFFMRPEHCASLFNEITISVWREYQKNLKLDGILSPLKEEIIRAYDEYSAITPIHKTSKDSYREYLKNKFPREKLYLTKAPTESGHILKSCFKRDIYLSFFRGKEFDYWLFLNYITEHTFAPLSYSALIEAKKVILAKKICRII